MNYRTAVKRNLEYMGSQAEDWSAVRVAGVELCDTGSREPQEMPVFEFPKGYSNAKSLYTGECCHLCGISIKNVYWIQNDRCKWLMPVGSECVTHFGEGDSGRALSKKTVWEQNKRLLVALLAMKRTLWQAYGKRINLGYGRYETRIWAHSVQERNAVKLHLEIKSCIGRLTDESGNAAITRWANKHRRQAEQLLLSGRELIRGHVTLDAENTSLIESYL